MKVFLARFMVLTLLLAPSPTHPSITIKLHKIIEKEKKKKTKKSRHKKK